MTEEKKYNKSIIKSILMIAIPIVFVNILQVMYSLIDTFWVGKLGANAIAAISISFPILFLMMAFANGITVAGSVFVSQYKGKNDKESISKFSGQTMLVVVGISLILSVIGYFAAEPLLRLVGATDEIMKDAIGYLQVSFLGLASTFVFFVFQSLMRGVGEVKKATYIIFSGVFLNLITVPLFVFGKFGIPAMGVTGSAIATIICQTLGSLIALYLLFISKKNEIHISMKDLIPDIKFIKQIFKVGIPSSIEQIVRSSGMILMIFTVTAFGTVLTAAYGLGSRMSMFVVIPALGFMIATSVLVGQAIGSGDKKRAEEVAKKAATMAFISLSIISILFFVFAKQIVGVFIQNDPIVTDISITFMKFLAVTFGMMGVSMTFMGAFVGSGNTILSMTLTTLQLLVNFIVALVLSKFTPLGYMGIFWSYPIAAITMFIIAIIIFIKGDWKDKKITEDVKRKEIVENETLMKEFTEE